MRSPNADIRANARAWMAVHSAELRRRRDLVAAQTADSQVSMFELRRV